jgi:sec-independent protein translocase protein TatB
MFGLGLWEIFAILLVAIVFINPKDLPKIARTLGKWYYRLKNFTKNLSTNINEIVEEEIKKPFEDIESDITSPVKELKDAINSPMKSNIVSDLMPDLKNTMPVQDFSLNLIDDPEKDDSNSNN